MAGLAILHLSLGGFVGSSVVILWSFLAVLTGVLFGGIPEARWWFVAYVAVILLAAALQPQLAIENQLPIWLVTTFFVLNVATVSSVAFVVLKVFVTDRRRLREIEVAYLSRGGSIGQMMVGHDFNPEIGNARRKDFLESSFNARFSPRPESISWIRQLSFQGNLSLTENERSGLLESRSRGASLGISLENGDNFNLGFTDSYEYLADDARISGATVPVGQYDFRGVQGGYSFGPQRRVSASVSARTGSYYSGTLTSFGIGNGRIEILPELTFQPSIAFNWIDLPELQETVGEFNQHVARARVTYSFTPRMFTSALVQYNSGSDAFSVNARLRWEWAPGSELFIVYTEDRDTDPVFLDGRDRWSELSNRALVVKVNRLFRL